MALYNPASASTLSPAYDAGTSAADQTLTLTSGKGGAPILQAGSGYTGVGLIFGADAATSGATTKATPDLLFRNYIWNGSTSVAQDNYIRVEPTNTSGRGKFTFNINSVDSFVVERIAGSATLLSLAPGGFGGQIISAGGIIVHGGNGTCQFGEATASDCLMYTGNVGRTVSNKADGASSIAWKTDTNAAWSNATAKLYSWLTGGTEKAYILASGGLVANYLQGNATASKPTAAVGYRGAIYTEQGGGGVADVAYICLKDAGGSYSWVQFAP